MLEIGVPFNVGRATAALFVDKVTTCPPVGAAQARVTVAVIVVGPVADAGMLSVLTPIGSTVSVLL